MSKRILKPSTHGRWYSFGPAVVSLALVIALLAGCKESHEALKLFHEGRTVLRFERDPVRAEALLLKALEVDPTLTHPNITLAELYMSEVGKEAGLYSKEKALRQLREALRKAPDHVGAHFMTGKIALRRGDLDLAEKEFATTRNLLDWPFSLADTRAWRELQLYEGFVLLDRGDFQGAKAKFELFNSNNRRWLNYLSHVGLMLAAAGRGDASELGKLKKKLKHLRKPTDPLALQGIVSIWEGKPAMGAEALKRRLDEMDKEAHGGEGSPAYEKFVRQRNLYRRVLAWAYRRAERPEEARSVLAGPGEDSAPLTINVLLAVFN